MGVIILDIGCYVRSTRYEGVDFLGPGLVEPWRRTNQQVDLIAIGWFVLACCLFPSLRMCLGARKNPTGDVEVD